MARISKLPVEQWDPELRDLMQADQASELERGALRMYAHCPELAKGIVRFNITLKGNRGLPERLIELVRLRVAFHNQCRSCMAIRYQDALADGVTEDLVCSLERPAEAADLSDAEKLAIEFGERMATNHLSIDDAFYDRLRAHFSEPQIVELATNIAFFVGFGRLAATWHMVEELPRRFQEAEGEIAPWGEQAVVVR
ncbi:MAG: hypothetical protein Tsb0016_01120 [Sphingomonadales bacterium]